ncbi:(2Fe-2S)-binding protein [Kitasatospora sp. NBC_00458]|uniref:(2Fe-2S)-binding protein n=1 Tax=Kitasatospora sp. NBC_00458 TaxID=2903568 RepID=UPI003FA5F775
MISSGPPVPAAVRAANPLDADYRRLLDLCPVLRVRLLADDEPAPSRLQGWYSAAELAGDPEALADSLAGEAARIAPVAAGYGTSPRPHVVASRLLHHYLWSVSVLIAGPWYLARRVPLIGGADLWMHAATGDLALRPRAHVTLAGEDELRAELRAAVVTHVEPLLTAFAAPARRGTRALWGMVTDDLASAIWYLGRMLDATHPAGEAGEAGEAGASAAARAAATVEAVLGGAVHGPAELRAVFTEPAGARSGAAGGEGESCAAAGAATRALRAEEAARPGPSEAAPHPATHEAAAVAAAGAVLPGHTEPLPGAADFRLLRGEDGRAHHTRTRLGCCLYYAIQPGNACLTCPRTADEERLRRL